MADGISELWRVGWRPSTPSITQWWTWEAGPWQLGGWAGVEGTNGVKDRAGVGSRLPQYGDWKNKGWEEGGELMEKSVSRIEVRDIWTTASFAKCLCVGWRWISWLFLHVFCVIWINKGALRHLARIFVSSALYTVQDSKPCHYFWYSSRADICERATPDQNKWWTW